jgi:hypothetical protein
MTSFRTETVGGTMFPLTTSQLLWKICQVFHSVAGKLPFYSLEMRFLCGIIFTKASHTELYMSGSVSHNVVAESMGKRTVLPAASETPPARETHRQ